jgi:hypothetical protein
MVSDSERGVEAGLLLVDGQVLCEPCAVRWTEQARKRLLLDRGEDCVYLQTTKPKRACCLKCRSRNPTAVADFQRELRRIAANHLLSQLTTASGRSHAGSFKRAHITEVETMWLTMPTTALGLRSPSNYQVAYQLVVAKTRQSLVEGRTSPR